MQGFNPYPAAAIGYAGFTPAHFHHYHDLQRRAFIGKASPTDMNILSQYVEVISRHMFNQPPFYRTWHRQGSGSGSSISAAQNPKPDSSREKRQPQNQSSKSTSPSSGLPPHKRLRLSTISQQDPPPLPKDEARQNSSNSTDDSENTSLSTPLEPTLPSSTVPTKPIPSSSSTSKEIPLSNHPEIPTEASVGNSSSTTRNRNESQESSLKPSQGEPPDTSSSPHATINKVCPVRASKPNHQRSLRISLLAQTLLSSERNDTQIPLSLTSLRSFLASLDPKLAFLAEPLHSAGLDSVEILSQFVAFEVSTRIEMIVMACREKDVKIKEEHLEVLEAAIERGREKDWN